jgi:hypothetical protein
MHTPSGPPPGVEFHTFYDLRQVDARVPPLDDWLARRGVGS